MDIGTKFPARTRATWRQRLLSVAIGLGAALVAAPGAAVTVPDLPLQTGTAYPPANIMFILDDSGSMNFVAMPRDVKDDGDGTNYGAVQDGLNDNPTDRSYLNNSLYYDPRNTYLAWMTDAGSRMTGGRDVTAVFTSWDQATTASGTRDLRDNPEGFFYVPKAGVTSSTNAADFDKYMVTTIAGVTAVALVQRRSIFLDDDVDVNNGSSERFTVNVPIGTTRLEVVLGGGSGNGTLIVHNPLGQESCNRNASNGNNEVCDLSGTIGVGNRNIFVAAASGNNVRNARLEVFVTSPVLGVPSARTQAAELTNIATWYSYHRSRMKAAKAGASEAFSQVGSNLRVGYDSIWNRLTGTGTTVGASAMPAYQIPVDTDGGLFRSANRTTWFNHMQAARGGGGTPLPGALQRAGRYFESTDASGPWGPGGVADQLSCRQNFAILTTDGYWNNNAGYTAVGDSDGTAGARIDPKTPRNASDFYRYAPASPYSDNFAVSGTNPTTRADTLADVAMHYWKRDLRAGATGLDNDVPSSTANPAFWQHMTTFSLSIGLGGNLNPQTDLPGITNGTRNWPDPYIDTAAGRIDDLWHAAVNGRGKFVAASNPTQFTQGLVDALTTVAERLGSASNVTSNSTSFQTDTRVYQASYVSGRWSGEVSAFDASASGLGTTPAWKASERIPATRAILTWNGTGGRTFPTTLQQGLLARATGLAPVTAADNADYIKGVRTREKARGGNLRDRSTVLGDIVNSSPMYSFDSKVLFVGANDGMLHAFTTVDIPRGPAAGTELFAYVPAGLDFAALSTLSDPQYTHRWFVDGPIAVSTRAQTPGANYLVGALGRGGRGVYGLNVTTPTSFGTNDVLWDHTGASLGLNMGHVVGEPLVVTLNDASSTKAVIVSNGINSPGGSAVLFILNLATGALIKEINTLAIGDNGLSAPRGADTNGDGKVDYVYAGDRLGNLWKFDLSSNTTTLWGVANSGNPMFIAQDSSGARQPITGGVGLAREPVSSDTWVVFGTGSFVSAGDVSNRTVQTMYGIKDDGTSRRPAGDLTERQIAVVGEFGGKDVRAFEANTPLPATSKGWFVDLDTPPNTGERIITAPRVSGRVMLTSSLVPPSNNSCDAGGTGYINAIDVFTGTSLREAFFDVNNNRNFDDDTLVGGGTNLPIGSVNLDIGMPTLPTLIDNLLVVGGSTGRLGQMRINPQGGNPRRVAWHEVVRK
jgi:type IV pilus assembly protein PilY1